MPPERPLLLGSLRAGVGHQASALWRRCSAEARGGRGRRPGSQACGVSSRPTSRVRSPSRVPALPGRREAWMPDGRGASCREVVGPAPLSFSWRIQSCLPALSCYVSSVAAGLGHLSDCRVYFRSAVKQGAAEAARTGGSSPPNRLCLLWGELSEPPRSRGRRVTVK